MPTPKQRRHKFHQRRKRQGKPLLKGLPGFRQPNTVAVPFRSVSLPVIIAKKEEPLAVRILSEDVFKLKDYGLSDLVHQILINQGIRSVRALVDQINNGNKLKSIGPARLHEIREVLGSVGVTV